MTRVLVFGTFDGLHRGHQAFLTQARALGDELVVCLAPDEVVERLKHHRPLHTFQTRLADLSVLPQVTRVVGGDAELGVYNCYAYVKPDLVAFGYDQAELATDFKRFQQVTGDETRTIVLKPYQAEIFKSSLLKTQA